MGTQKKTTIFPSGRGFFKDLDMPWSRKTKMRWHRVPAYRPMEEWDDERSQVGAMEGSAQAEKRCGLRLYRFVRFGQVEHWHPIVVDQHMAKWCWRLLNNKMVERCSEIIWIFVQIYAFSASACRICVLQSKSCCLHLLAAGFFLRPNYWGSLTQVMAW